jgi:hypothetical protein
MLTWRAIAHVLQPRLLFPNKPELGTDSWLIWQYAGLRVAGLHDDKTSVGFGYMGEFYIDFGPLGMMGPLLLLGILVGLIHQSIQRLAPSRLFGEAAAAVLMMNAFSTYGAEIAKMLGGILTGAIVFGAILYYGGTWIDAQLRAYPRVTRVRPTWRPQVSPRPLV